MKTQKLNARALYLQRRGRLTIEITYVHRNHVLLLVFLYCHTYFGGTTPFSFSLAKYPHFLFQDFPCQGTFGTSFVHLKYSRNYQKIQEDNMLRVLHKEKIM